MRITTCLTIATLCAGMAGCGPRPSETGGTEAPGKTTDSPAEVNKEARPVISEEDRERVAGELRAAAEEVQSQIEDIQRKSATATAEAREAMEESVEQLRAWKLELFMQMDRLSKATADERSDLSAEAGALLDEIERWWKTWDAEPDEPPADA